MVPAGTLIGTRLNDEPLQIVDTWFAITGLGLTVTTRLKFVPCEVATMCVTVAVTTLVLFTNVCDTAVWPVWALAPLMDPPGELAGNDQLYVSPTTAPGSLNVKAVPLQVEIEYDCCEYPL